MHERLALDLPADARSLRAARLATLDAASRAQLDCDAADDLCLALDEMCFTAFLRAQPSDRILLEISVHQGVEIQGWAMGEPGSFGLDDFSHLLVDLMVDVYTIESTADGVHFTLRKHCPSVPIA